MENSRQAAQRKNAVSRTLCRFDARPTNPFLRRTTQDLESGGRRASPTATTASQAGRRPPIRRRGAAPAAASRADEGAGSQASGGRLKGSANPFDQEPGNSGPNPQGHSEHEGRGNNVCHASFHLVPRRRLTGPVASKRRAKRPATISKPPSVITRSCGMWLRLFACPLRGFRIQSLRPSEASWNSKAPLRRGAFFIGRREGNVDAALGLSRWRMSPPGR